MPLIQRGHTFRWGHALPEVLQRRLNCGGTLGKSLSTRDRGLADAFAKYMSETAIRLFGLVEAHPQLTAREVGLLIRNLKMLTETVEARQGRRTFGHLLEQDLAAETRALPGLDLQRSALISFREHLKSVLGDLNRVVGDETSHGQTARRTPKLSEAMLQFLKEWRLNVATRTLELRRSCLRTFMVIVGDKPIGDVDRNDLAQFKSVLQKMPTLWERTYPGVPIAEILAKPNNAPRLQPSSVNNYIGAVHAFFEWAHAHGYVTFNPARKLKIRLKRSARDLRKRFYAGDLKQIFEESLYFARSSHPSAIAERKRDPRIYHHFWIPLLALFSGLRASEIIGLERQDIRREAGVWCLVVRPNRFRDVKSMSSKRKVPIHPILLRMGFLDAIDQQSLEAQDYVWPGLPRGKRRVGGHYALMWSKSRKRLGIDDPRKTFHSFRHTFVHALTEVETRFEVVAEIAGHYVSSGLYGRYRKYSEPPDLLKSIKKIRFPVQLDHLMPSGSQ